MRRRRQFARMARFSQSAEWFMSGRSLPVRERGSKRREQQRECSAAESLPVRERGSKRIHLICHVPTLPLVAPRAGAWIETSRGPHRWLMRLVAPRAGAWIETRQIGGERGHLQGRSPCGSVDRNRINDRDHHIMILSLPVRERGSKPMPGGAGNGSNSSLPVRERGSKRSL